MSNDVIFADDGGAVAPDTAAERRLVKGAVSTSATAYVMAHVQDALDEMSARVFKRVIEENGKGQGLSAQFAVAMWYQWLAIHALRMELARGPKSPAVPARQLRS